MLQVSNSAWSDLGFLRRCWSRILRSLKGEKARSRAPFRIVLAWGWQYLTVRPGPRLGIV